MAQLAVRIKSKAHLHITAAAAFYAAESDERIVAKFFRSMDQAFERISVYPESCPLYHRGTRRILLNYFPYWVYYRVAAMRSRSSLSSMPSVILLFCAANRNSILMSHVALG